MLVIIFLIIFSAHVHVAQSWPPEAQVFPFYIKELKASTSDVIMIRAHNDMHDGCEA